MVRAVKKLVQGIVEFRRSAQQGYRQKLERLAGGQEPDALLLACSDSRVVPNTFASTNPGDVFVVRNVGNMVPYCDGGGGCADHDVAEAAALEFAVLNLNVKDIIICGHSECGAIKALLEGRESLEAKNLRNWLRHGDDALARAQENFSLDPDISFANKVSQINVLVQIEHVKTYPKIQARLKAGTLRIHGWWFDIKTADVYSFNDEKKGFVILDEEEANRLLVSDTN